MLWELKPSWLSAEVGMLLKWIIKYSASVHYISLIHNIQCFVLYTSQFYLILWALSGAWEIKPNYWMNSSYKLERQTTLRVLPRVMTWLIMLQEYQLYSNRVMIYRAWWQCIFSFHWFVSVERHYGLNRFNRRTVREDIPVARVVQSDEERQQQEARYQELQALNVQ